MFSEYTIQLFCKNVTINEYEGDDNLMANDLFARESVKTSP